LEIKRDQKGMLIGKDGRTLESLPILINRMVNKRVKSAERTGPFLTVGPLNGHDRRIIYLVLKENLSLKTESLGEGELKKVKIVPVKKEGQAPETVSAK